MTAGSSSSLDQVPLRVGSLFSGIGGMDLGLHRAGAEHAFFCEWERDRRVVLRRHWPEPPVHDDVRTLTGDDHGEHGAAIDGLAGEPATSPRDLLTDDRWLLLDPVEVPDVDLLAGGFPCQDLSVAGRRRGLAGARSGLFFQFMRLADDLVRPGGFVLIENVPGLFSSQNGRDFAIVLATLAELGFHDLAWRTLDSRHFGVPQRRRRVFILARRARGGLCSEVLLEPEGSEGNPTPGHKARPGAAGGAGGGPRAPGVAAPLTAGGHERGVSAPGRRKEDDENLVADTLRANGGRDHSGKRGNRTDQQPLAVLGEVPALTRKGNQQDDQESQQLVTTATGENETHALSTGTAAGCASEDGTGRGTPIVTALGEEATHSLTSEGHDGSEDGTGRGTPIVGAWEPDQRADSPHEGESGPLRRPSRGAGTPIAFGHTNADPARDSSESDAPAVRSGGEGSGSGAPAVCIHGDALGRTGDAETDSPDAEGRMRKRPPGMGVSEDESFTLNATAPHAVGFAQNQRGEVRETGDEAGSLQGQGTNQRTNVQTFAKRHNAEDDESAETWDESDYARTLADRGTPTEAAVDRARSMVRRLTPTECERLQGLPDGWSAPFGPSLSDAPSWYELGSARRGQAGRAASHGETRQGSPPATAVRTSHRGAGGLGISEDVAHTVEKAGPEAVSFATGNAQRGEPREGEVTALQKGAGPHGAASHHVYTPEDERTVSEQIDDGDLAQSLTTRFGNSGPDLPDGEANFLVPDGDRAAVAAGSASPLDPQPDGPRYAGLGDAVTATVAEWIGSRLVARMEAERG